MIAAGLDNQVKFIQSEKDEMKVSYKLKVPSEVYSFDFSYDGNHYALGLNDGTMIIKSKMLETIEDDEDHERKLIDQILQPTYKSTSKNYKYFYRG